MIDNAYSKSVESVITECRGSTDGLSSFEAQNRLKGGKNIIAGKKKQSEFLKFL